jgi:hypothetical protein
MARQAAKELAKSWGGPLLTAPVLREFLNRTEGEIKGRTAKLTTACGPGFHDLIRD